jgi:hypothetical protein
MQERTWLKALPKIEKELELINACSSALQACSSLPNTPEVESIKLSASNILMRYLQQLDILTRPNETPLKLDL